ncbi:MAG: hybrid sensor histidine kinase/response regulator [Ignavibacteriaceae bacterium]|nr:hybrid sensor histidine kinase/response regulator [Ignavibacteriaceae bacterium]
MASNIDKEKLGDFDYIKVLIVDDEPQALKVLKYILIDLGFDVVAVTDGKSAIEVCDISFDMIFLDIMMPGLNGFEVCRAIKDNPALRDIPVIFVTAVNSSYDLQKAFVEGAVDYIIKPINRLEVQSRVKNHLTLRLQSKKLIQLNEKIAQSLTDLKFINNELATKNKNLEEVNNAKDKILSVISHDIRTPSSVIFGYSDLLISELNEMQLEEAKQVAVKIKASSEGLIRLLDNLLLWSSAQTGRIQVSNESFDIAFAVNIALEEIEGPAKDKNVEIISKIDEELKASGDKTIFCTVIRNLISNAIKFIEPGGKILITAFQKTEFVEIKVIDTGKGIPEEVITTILTTDSFYSSVGTNNEKGTGFGLQICKEFVKLNGGTLTIESKIGKGSVFTFTIPSAT